MWTPKALDEMLRARVIRAAEPAIVARDPVPALAVRDLGAALDAHAATLPTDPLAAPRAEITATRAEADALIGAVQRLTAELVTVRKLATEARTEARAAEVASAEADARVAGLAERLAKLTPKEA